MKEANLKQLQPLWIQLCDIDILEKSKTKERKISGLPEVGGREGGMNRWSTEDFLGRETILYDTVMVDTGLYTFAQTHTMCDTKNEP
jgi:hypothetical protein